MDLTYSEIALEFVYTLQLLGVQKTEHRRNSIKAHY
jgi:hypothetical protein